MRNALSGTSSAECLASTIDTPTAGPARVLQIVSALARRNEWSRPSGLLPEDREPGTDARRIPNDAGRDRSLTRINS
jgi:hypothetical protein